MESDGRMKKRLDIVFLSFGVGFFLFTILGRMLVHHSNGNGVPLWLLLPSFLLISIGDHRSARTKTEAELVQEIWFAPNN